MQQHRPYLRSGKQLSLGGLGLIVVDAIPTDIKTSLIAEPVRFPAVCLANEEPLLVDGVLFQLGAQPVSKFVSSEQCSLVSLILVSSRQPFFETKPTSIGNQSKHIH